MAERKVIVEIKNVNKIYGTNHVVKDLDLKVYEGEFLTLLGSSGCGKTTTLRMVAGFEEPTSGTITVEGEPIDNKEPFERNVNTVFQSYALFPHMTIFDNVAYGLKMKKVSKPDIKKRVTEMLELVQLGGFEKRYPSQLSGGQKQRVAIARALINKPKVLLLDEPLGALDLKLRKQMQLELKRLQKKLNMSIIIITHDLGVISEMADEVVVMYAGEIVEKAKTRELFDDPKHPYTVGLMNSVPDVDEDVERLRTLEGLVPSLYDMPKGCRFAPRCQFACPECEKERIKLLDLEDGRQVRCRRYEK